MDNHNVLVEKLKEAYKGIFEANQPDWAVHKITKPAELVRPTIPFVGKKYAEQKTKILVYASAETLNDHYYGKTTRSWLDCDNEAIDRHRRNFEISKTKDDYFPDVHISPMNDGALAVAIMYLASLITNKEVKQPREFYETICFGNYSKFSIETLYQKALRERPGLSDEEKKELKKKLGNRNVDTADKKSNLSASFEYIRKDIEILKPDFIIMPSIANKDMFDSITPGIRKVQIYQMVSTVVNQMAPLEKNNLKCELVARDIETLPPEIRKAYGFIHRVSREKYKYVFDHLDKAFNLSK